mgnify:FL=1
MKKVLIITSIILTLGVISIFLFLQYALHPASHKYLMIDAINRGDYASALSHISQVDNWEVDVEVDLNHGIPFLLYADSLNVDSAIVDSATIYVCSQLEELATTEHINGNYEVALQHYDLLLSLYTRFVGNENIYVAKTLSNVGCVLYEMADYENAEIILLESVKIWKTLPSLLHIEYIYVLSMLSENFERQKYYDSAEQCHLEKLTLAQEMYGTDSRIYLSLLGYVGTFYFKIENYSKAEEYLVDSMDTKMALLKQNDIAAYNEFYPTYMNNLGYLYRYKDMYDKALFCFLEEKNRLKLSQDTASLDYVVVLQNIGALYSDMYDYKAAEQYCVEALNIYNNISIDTLSMEYLQILSTLGNINIYKKNYSKAEALYLAAIKIQSSISSDDIELAKLYSSLGLLYTHSGKYKLSEKYYFKALNICGSSSHMLISDILNYLGGLYVEKGDYKSAENTYLKSLKIQNEFQNNTQRYANTLVELGTMYGNMGDFERSKQNILEGLKVWKNNGCDRMDSINIAFALEKLGRIYQQNGECIKAEESMTESQSILNHVLDTSNIHSIRFKLNLGKGKIVLLSSCI